MLTFLVQGEDPTEADIEQVEAPKLLPWILRDDLAYDDFETPGYIRNPEYPVGENDALPRPLTCAGCNKKFTSVPLVWKGKAVLIPNTCTACEEILGPWRSSICPARNPGNIKAKRFLRGAPLKDEIFVGWTLINPVISPICEPAKDSSSGDSRRMEAPTTMTTTAPTGHHKHGPSSLKHKEICAHWRSAPGTNPVAEEGTRLHERLVTRDYKDLEEDQLTAVMMVAGLFDDLVKDLGPGAIVYQEKQLDVAGLTWGTSDLVAFSADRRRGVIADAKFGWIEVEDAETNMQGQCYTRGAWNLEPLCEEMMVVFAQPRCNMVSEHTFYRSKDLPRIHGRIEAVMAGIANPDAPYNAQPDNCKYCGAKGSCNALLQMAKHVAPRIGDFEIPAELVPANISDPKMMALALKMADVLKEWCSEVGEHAREMLQNGTDVPGYELGERSAPRGIVNASAAYQATKGVLTADEFISTVSKVGLGDLEKIYAAKVAAQPGATRGSKGRAKQDLEDRLRDADALKPEGAPVFYLKPVRDRKLSLNDAAAAA